LVSASQAACGAAANGVLSCPIDSLTTEQPYNLLLTTSVDRCYAGVISNTTTVRVADNLVNTNAADSSVARQTLAAPYPRYAQVVYVQSNGSTHSLGLSDSDNRLITDNLHLRAAAPAWSPDGTRLAFFGEEGISEFGGVYQGGNGVWMIDIRNGEAQNPRLLVAQDHVKNIAWSPDGTKLAFEVGPPSISPEIMVVDARSGESLSRFTGEQPAWSLDNEKLVVKACLSKCGLWLVDLQGRPERQLTFDDGDSYPAWSPTGQYLAFSSRRDGDWEIYLLRLADNTLQRLTHRPGSDTTPVFGPCGENIYLRTDAYGSWWLTVMKLDGSDERKILEGVGPSEDWGLARPAVY
jgi:TolB protein